ncbi:MAG: DNA polymerase III subunit beta [Bacteroidota bacterium]
MKFSANSSDLSRALAKVNAVVPSKSPSPILENVLFDLLNETLNITATDMDISLSVAMQVKAGEDGKIAIPAKRLLDTIRSLPDTEIIFIIDTTTNKIKITTKNGEYSLTGESAKDYPILPQFKGIDELVLDTSTLKKLIHRTAFAVSTDELRPAMMGVLFQSKGNELRTVATDGHRLVKVVQKLSKASSLKRDIIVPAKSLSLVSRLLETGDNSVSVSDTHIKIAFDRTVLISRLIDETYPNYESVIPQDNTKMLTVVRDNIIASLRRVALYASATTHQVRFELSKNQMKVSAQDIDFGGEAKETVECVYDSETLEIGFNSIYMLDILTHMEEEKVVLKFSTPTRAGIVSPASASTAGEDVMMLVMPVRLNV